MWERLLDETLTGRPGKDGVRGYLYEAGLLAVEYMTDVRTAQVFTLDIMTQAHTAKVQGYNMITLLSWHSVTALSAAGDQLSNKTRNSFSFKVLQFQRDESMSPDWGDIFRNVVLPCCSLRCDLWGGGRFKKHN